MGPEDSRRCDWTAPPRWAMPWTSACLNDSPSAKAALSMTNAIERIPCPPTPARMMSCFNAQLLFFRLSSRHSLTATMTERPL